MEKIFKDNPNAKITINPPKPRTVFTVTTAKEANFQMPRPSPDLTQKAAVPAPISTFPPHHAPSKTPVTIFHMTTFTQGPPKSSAQPHTSSKMVVGPPQSTPSPAQQKTTINPVDAKGQLPRPSSMPNLSNLTILPPQGGSVVPTPQGGSPYNMGGAPSPVPVASTNPAVPVTTPTMTSAALPTAVNHTYGHATHTHTHLHHSHHPHVSHPYQYPHMLAVGHHHHSHHPTHTTHPIPSRASHSRSSSFSSTHSPPSEEISPASSNSSRAGSPTERLPPSFGKAVASLELQAHHFSDFGRPPMMRRFTDEELWSDSERDGDPDHWRRQKRAALCLLLRLQGEEEYTALYLDLLTVDDLKAKVAERYQLDASTIRSVTRINKKGLPVKFDDSVLEHTEHDEGFQLDIIKSEDGGLSLKFTAV